MTLKAGKKHNIPVSMCGEMAGDPRYTRLLLAMGLEHFSTHPNAILVVKQIINETDLTLLPSNTLQIMDMNDTDDAQLLLEKINSTNVIES
jgi:phosphotransferase system enzyme I (PtsI)